MAAAAILDQLISGIKIVSAYPLLVFIRENIIKVSVKQVNFNCKIWKSKMAAAAILNFLNYWSKYSWKHFTCIRFWFAVFVWRFVVQLIFLAQMFLGAIRKNLPHEPTEILSFKMAAVAMLDQLIPGIKNVSAYPLLVFILRPSSVLGYKWVTWFPRYPTKILTIKFSKEKL